MPKFALDFSTQLISDQGVMSSEQDRSMTGEAAGALPPPYFESPDRRFRLYQGDCLDLLPRMPEAVFDLVFADPPYFLSNDGITCHAGRMVSVNKGKWDRSLGFRGNYEFTKRWLAACQRVMKPNATIWVSGTSHIIHLVGCAMDELGFKILNDITWVKPNPPPNLSCRYFTHATETIIWAGRDRKTRHTFNYALMKRLNGGKQMKSVWTIDAPGRDEKVFGKHPTQKPLALLERIVAVSSSPCEWVLDPFAGSRTTGIAAARLGRASTGLDAQAEFLELAALRCVGVPQADCPERILDLVAAHQGCEPAVDDLSCVLGVTSRQVQYYRQAAQLLGLLSVRGNKYRLTSDGEGVCGPNRGSGRHRLAHIMCRHPLIQLARRRAQAPEGIGAVADFLVRCTALGRATCLRRAQTLIAWIRWVDEVRSGATAAVLRRTGRARGTGPYHACARPGVAGESLAGCCDSPDGEAPTRTRTDTCRSA
jgi:site-specific DNA-methyltransferase (adenine-specific)